ncbi:MAG TPA: aldo/keto reductase [Candidatus Marinimicrobia bacterium]|nr:aldo/keto reductase [Candidatus Neomarinimicrobiota bacterium]
MESQSVGNSELRSSRLVYGCMRIVGDYSAEARQKGKQALRTALEAGFTHFDHADIYGDGKCEELFGEVLQENPGLRQKILITSKCGIRRKGQPNPEDPARYDFSEGHILQSVAGSLKRLKTDYLDILLLHRPDYLFSAEEVAGAFEKLKNSGKVRHFGVSNFRPSQVNLLQKYCPIPIITNQVEINIHNISSLLDGTLDQCQELNISPQAWCPLGGVVYPAWGNTFTEETEIRIKREFDLQAEKYNTANWIIMLAWLLKHPARIFPIIGTTTPARITAALQALTIKYSREDWYRLLEARNGYPVP